MNAHYILHFEIFFADFTSSPRILSVGVSECGMCGGDGCSLTVVWSEVTVTCDGSVSGYVLTVTPPTSDCPDCVVVDGSSVYTLSGNETQYIINVNGSQSLVYDMTVRAKTCDGGDLIEPYTANLTGIYIVRMPSFFMGANFRGILEMAVRINFRGSKFRGNF